MSGALVPVLLAALLAVAGSAAWILRRDRIRSGARERELTAEVAQLAGERDRALADLTRATTVDALTGLGNRRYLVGRLTEALADRRRECALVVVGLDDFAAVNDYFGPGAGDQVLLRTAQRIAATLRPDDVAARLAGTEFAVLVAGASAAGVSALTDRLGHAVGEAQDVEGFPLRLRPCVGVAWSQGRPDGTELVQEARSAMHEARAAGPHQVRTYDARSRSVPLHHVSLRLELPEAVEQRRVALMYQPVVRLADGALTGMTAVATWVRGDGELVWGRELALLAEESGWGPALTTLTLAEGTAQLSRWADEGHLLDLHVDLPLHHLDDAATLVGLHDACEGARASSSRLVLEVRGAHRTGGPDEDEALRSLQRRGASVALTQWNGLAELRRAARLPFDLAVMPAELVDATDRDPRSAVLARGLTDLARTLEVKQLVDGVETRAVAATWTGLGCELGRGALYSPPRTAYALESFLQRRPAARQRAAL